MQKPWGGVFVALGSMAAMQSPAPHSPMDANASWGSSVVGSMPRYKTIAFSVLLVAVSVQFFHLPLIMKMGDLQLKIPLPPPFPKGRGEEGAKVTQKEIIGWENVVETWHKTMWSFRAEIIEKLPFSSMDDEEEVEFERISTVDRGEDRNTWLTAHLLFHMSLVIVSHVHRSVLMPVLALVSDCMLLVSPPIFLPSLLPLSRPKDFDSAVVGECRIFLRAWVVMRARRTRTVTARRVDLAPPST